MPIPATSSPRVNRYEVSALPLSAQRSAVESHDLLVQKVRLMSNMQLERQNEQLSNEVNSLTREVKQLNSGMS